MYKVTTSSHVCQVQSSCQEQKTDVKSSRTELFVVFVGTAGVLAIPAQYSDRAGYSIVQDLTD